MRQYEAILGKIVPVFYKFEVYENNYDRYADKQILSYLERAKLPKVLLVDIPLDLLDRNRFSMNAIENTKYYYRIGVITYQIEGKELYIKTVGINEKPKLLTYYVNFSEFIVIMVINKFSLENEIIEPSNFIKRYEDLFIALVGRDTYEAIRANIK